MSNEITLTKGSTSVTVYARRIAENYSNKLFLITPATSTKTHDVGHKDTRVVDLLRITHQLVLQCYITGSATKTAKQIKDDLVIIYDGGGINGGVSTMVYDGDSIKGYLEKLNFVEISADNPSTTIKDFAKYEVTITFVEGVAV